MKSGLGNFLSTQSWSKVLRVLLLSPRPKGLREIADLAEMSPSGTQDVLRRFSDSGLVVSKRSGNKLLFELVMCDEERDFLQSVFAMQSAGKLSKRSKLFSIRQRDAHGWIEQTASTVSLAKRKQASTSHVAN